MKTYGPICAWGFLAGLCCLAATTFAMGAAPHQPVSLAVLNFINRNPGDGWDWLQTGLADMLITDLSHCGRFQIVTREDMQSLVEETKISGSGLVDPLTAVEAGRMLKVDHVLVGSFLRERDEIRIECHVVNVGSQTLRRVEFVEGKDADTLTLEKRLARKIVENFEMTLDEKELTKLMAMRVKSLDASHYYYEALRKYERGDYFDALVTVRRAVRSDVGFEDARFLLGRFYFDSGEVEHALVELRAVASGAATAYYTPIAAFMAGQIAQDFLSDEADALRSYRAVGEIEKKGSLTPLSAMAAFRCADILERGGDSVGAFAAYRACEPLCLQTWSAEPYHLWMDLSRNLQWHTLACRQYIALYTLQRHLSGGSFPVDTERFIVVGPTSNRIQHSGSGPGGLRGESYEETNRPPYLDREGVRYLLAESGYAITGLRVTLDTRPAPNPAQGHKPQPEMQFCNFHVSDICGNRGNRYLGYKGFELPNAGRAEGTIAFQYPVLGCELRVREGYDIELTSLDMEFSLVPSTSALVNETQERLASVFSTRAREGQGPNIVSLSVSPLAGDQFVIMANEGMPWASVKSVRDAADLSREGTGSIWQWQGDRTSGEHHWTRLSVNSLRFNYHPSVSQDLSGRTWLLFCSKRGGKAGVGLWITSSVNLRDWDQPRRLDLNVEWEDENRKAGEWDRFKRVGSPRLLIDSKGVFWAAFWLNHEVFITNSSDSYRWRKPVNPAPLAFQPKSQSIALCEHDDGDMLVAFNGVSWPLKPNRPSPDSELGLLIGKVSPELQLDRREMPPGFGYTQAQYGWPGSPCPLALGQMPDGRYVLVYNRTKSLLVATSRDLERWEKRSLGPAVACAAISGARLAVATCSNNEPSVTWYSLVEELSKPAPARDVGNSGAPRWQNE